MFKIHGPPTILECQKNIKLRQKWSHMKDTGKSSSRKLRRVVYYLLYRMDPQKTHYKISFSAKMSKIFFFSFLDVPPLTPIALRRGLCIPPLTPDQPSLKGGHYVNSCWRSLLGEHVWDQFGIILGISLGWIWDQFWIVLVT